MKILLTVILLFILGVGVKATPLEEKIKNFTEAIKTVDSGKASLNPMVAQRLPMLAGSVETASRMPGGEANLEMTVTQILSTCQDASVQKAGEALLTELRERKKARIDALTMRVNAVLTHVSEILSKSQKPQELDSILDELQKVQVPGSGAYGYDPETQVVMSNVSSAYQFVAQWQDYLSAQNSGNLPEAQNLLRNLLNSRPPGGAALVPRSEILARTVELAKPSKSPADRGASPSVPSPTDEGPILSKIKTLDDIESVLPTLRADPSEGDLANKLTEFAVIYADAKNGLPLTVDFDPNNYVSRKPSLERIRSMLLLYILPRCLNSTAPNPNPNEMVDDYLKRAVNSAVTTKNWVLLGQILGAEIKIFGTRYYGTGTLIGTRTFLAGLNQEIAGQYGPAVTSFEIALREPDELLPTQLIGDHLTTIMKDHPEEFQQGLKVFLNPPPVYSFISRSMPPPRGYTSDTFPNPEVTPLPIRPPVAPTAMPAPGTPAPSNNIRTTHPAPEGTPAAKK